MALHNEHADILGGPIMQRPESGLFAAFSQYYFVFRPATLLGLSLLVWIACARGLEHLKKHRELRHKKAMRRKHGIPDSDCRPFAVAYAAAKRAHLEREAFDRKKTTNYVSDHNTLAVDQRTNAQRVARGLRRRVSETIVQLHDYQHPGKHASLYDDKRPEVLSLDFVDRYNPSPRRRPAVLEPSPVEHPPVRRASRKDLTMNLDHHEESKKRSFEDENDVGHETLKKSRTDGDEHIVGDERADRYAQYSDMPLQRTSRESLGRQPEDNYVHTNGQEGSKHINDLHDEDHEPVDEAMEATDEDEVTGLTAVARGKKRDRAEAGSTFGGDDEEDIRNGRTPHYRKRRTILRKRTDIPTRGQKRDRGAESEGEEGSETSQILAQRSSKKKRGKKAASDEIGEMSADDFHASKDPLCDGHRVGDEWEADGIQYKVGDKGERLRLTLVKKAKNKYHMPQDSQHPDRSAALEIYVETWMTDEQYKQAEGRQELVWQEVPREPGRSRTPDVLGSPAKNGKNLLWDVVKSSPTRRPSREFIPAGVPTRINPFEQWRLQPTPRRRVASSSIIGSPIVSGVTDSPTRPGFRGFSKWEKQDREAEAMARIRAKVEEQKKAQTIPQKSAVISTSVTAPELGAKPLFIPTIILTPVSAGAAEGKSDDSTPPSKSNTSTFSAAPSTSDSIKGTVAAASTTPGLSLPASSIPAATTSTISPSAQTILATTSSTASLSPLAFTKPPQLQSSISTTTSSPTISNFFGKGTSVGVPSVSNSMSSPLGPQPQPPSTESTSKPASFSFAKLDTSSSTSSLVALPITKSQMPAFGVTSTSSPSSATSVPVSLGTKTETPVLPPVSTTTTTESTKSTTPLFSFSGAPPAPKFSFGPSTTSTSAPGFTFAPGTAPQPKSTLKFSQTPPGATDSASTSTVPVIDELKKPIAPMSIFGTATGSNEPVKPSLFGTTSAFGNSVVSPSTSVTRLYGKSGPVDGDSSVSASPKPTLASASTPSFTNAFSSTPAGTLASSNTPPFSFIGTSSGSKPAEKSKPVSMFGGSFTEVRPTFTFNASTEHSKPASIFGGNTEGSKPLSVFGGTAEMSRPSSVFGGVVDGSKATFAPSDVAEYKSTPDPTTETPEAMAPSTTVPDSSIPPNNTDISKPATASGSTAFGASPPMLTFTFGKEDAASNTSTSTTIQAKPATPFTFGASSSMNGPVFGQPSSFGTSGETSQSVFGKPTNGTANQFGFLSTGGSGSSSTFAFGKPTAQNQKQEQ